MQRTRVMAVECRVCGRPVRLRGGSGVPDELREAVHADDGSETGPDGHLAAPVQVPAAPR